MLPKQLRWNTTDNILKHFNKVIVVGDRVGFDLVISWKLSLQMRPKFTWDRLVSSFWLIYNLGRSRLSLECIRSVSSRKEQQDQEGQAKKEPQRKTYHNDRSELLRLMFVASWGVTGWKLMNFCWCCPGVNDLVPIRQYGHRSTLYKRWTQLPKPRTPTQTLHATCTPVMSHV